MSRRREFLIAGSAGLCALAAPLASFAQQGGKVWRVGALRVPAEFTQVDSDLRDGFLRGLKDLGYVEGKNLVIEWRFADGKAERLPGLAAELVRLKVDVIVASGTPSASAAQKATTAIPIVMLGVSDPVATGLVKSLARPGGNITGLTSMTTELYTKRLDLLRQILPGMLRVGFLYNPDNSNDALGLKQFETDCGKLQFTSIRAPVRKAEEVATAFKSLQHDKAQGLIVSQASTNLAWLKSIVEQAAQHRLPTIYPLVFCVDQGGLIAYAVNALELYRRAAAYADKIFKGAKAGDLPIEQPSKFETVINLKTAKKLGIKIPDVILLRSDKVIE